MILIKLATKSEKPGTPRSRKIARYGENAPEGYVAVYKPYGPSGRGYYYVREEQEVNKFTV